MKDRFLKTDGEPKQPDRSHGFHTVYWTTNLNIMETTP